MVDQEPDQQVKKRKRFVRAFSFYEADDKLVAYIAEYLGTSKSEAVRSAVRAYAGQLATIDKR